MNLPQIGNDLADDLIGAFAHDHLVGVYERDHSVVRLFDGDNHQSVDDNRAMVESGYLNHACLLSSEPLSHKDAEKCRITKPTIPSMRVTVSKSGVRLIYRLRKEAKEKRQSADRGTIRGKDPT